MKNKNNLFALTILIVAIIAGCKKDFELSKIQDVNIPMVESYMEPTYIYSLSSSGQSVFELIPDTLALLIDDVYGFENGFGGITGRDSLYLTKGMLMWPDTTSSGANTIAVSAINLGGYKVTADAALIIVSDLEHPGPTDISGSFERTINSYVIHIEKLAAGVFLIDNVGGAAADGTSYLLYNYESSSGLDSLVFPIQEMSCGAGLKLVSPSASGDGTANSYNAFPPEIISDFPLTFSWKVYEFPSTEGTAVHPEGGAYCAWGDGARIFVKQ